MANPRAALVILTAGLLTFGAMFTLMQFSRSADAPGQPVEIVASQPEQVAPDSIAAKVRSGDAAVGVPTTGSEVLLRDVKQGDRVDILASFAPSSDTPPLTAVVVRGATVLRAPSPQDPLLVEVPQSDVLVVAHLVEAGTRLGFAVWPAGATDSPSAVTSLDAATARALFGLAASPTPAPTLPISAASAPPRGTESGFLYQVQPGDTWIGIAAIFGRPVTEIKQWNEAAAEDDPVPGRLVFIPRPS